MENKIKVLGVLWIVYAAIGFVLSFAMFSFFFGLSFISDIDTEGAVILRIMAIVTSISIGFTSIPELIGGIWLMKKKQWARILVIIMSFFNILAFPFGTAIAIYSLIVLFGEDASDEFN